MSESSDLRLDYVSPLPPVRSGIADYSRDLVPALTELCDLRIIAVPGQEISEEIRRQHQPASAAELGAEDRLPFYQMGNNPYHEEVQRLALEVPGVITLHDVVLHHLLIEATLAKDDFEGYAERLTRDHGWIGDLVAKARYWGELSSAAMFGLPVHRTLVRRQRGILVHSQWAAQQLLEENPDLAVRVVPMGIPIPGRVEEEVARAFRRSRGLPLDHPLLGSFGFQTPIKRTEVVIEALAEPGLEDAHLLIAGEVSPHLALADKAAMLGVADRVHITGFLPYDEFEAAITACDLCINLRYPTAGETSASLLRVLAVGRPAVVSDYAQFRELPEEVALAVPLGEGEAHALAQSVGEVLAKPAVLGQMGLAARTFVKEKHDPQAAAAAVVESCLELRDLEPAGEDAARIAPPTTLLWRDLPGDIEVSGADGPWPEGERRELVVRLINRGVARWLATKETPGGVQLTVEWRSEIGGEALEEQQNELPRALDSDEAHEFRFALRRPLGTRFLVIEPHIDKLSGLSAFGGPSWVGDLGDATGSASSPGF
ncbi:MAG: glycosyltransferase family 4 protein [bacterium]|nr:glycosyltransferase family 4 protein [bacterium]